MKKTFYITTPIYYPNGKYHIGTAYTTCFCDSYKRYKAQCGYDTFFLTGDDEHGQKIELTAKERGITPQKHVDEMADYAKKIWSLLKVEYSDFIRTTEERHTKVVEEIFDRLMNQGDIYLGNYEGEYCVYDETFYTKLQVGENHICPDCGRPTKIVKEEAYFLKLSNYSDRLLKYIEDNPDFITPESRKNEVISFIKSGLNDLCVSRTSFSWGVPVKANPKHVVYVWIDALTNYISALGYHSKDESLYEKYWNGDEVVHVVGKDILRFHAIIWPIILMAINEPITFKLFVHGWYLMKDGKMSKSKGNVIYPEFLVNKYGLDSFRYYIVKELPYGGDGIFTPEDYVARYNVDLANDYGNLVSRTLAMAKKYFNLDVRKKESKLFKDLFNNVKEEINQYIKNYHSFMAEMKMPQALMEISKIVNRTNKLIDETEPWVLAKDESRKEDLESTLYYLLEGIRIATCLYEPYLLNTCPKVYKALNIDPSNILDLNAYNHDDYHLNLLDGPLFPRLDEKEIEVIKEEMTPKVEPENRISIDDFDKVELVVGKILESKRHPNANKLLVSKIDVGSDVRQIVSGIAECYAPEDIIGKKVLVVKNLNEATIRGEKSQGMVLCSTDKNGKYHIIEVNGEPGDKIS